MPSNFESVIQEHRKSHPNWSFRVSSKKQTLSFGDIETSISIEGLDIKASPLAFLQNHPEQSLNIYLAVRSIAEKMQIKAVLDLYCGIGISSLLLASKNMHVVGVEYNETAIKLAKMNAANNKIDNVEFIQGDVEKKLPDHLKTKKPELVVINPPRQGITSQVIQELLKYKPAHLIYISCMPATLARDLKSFCSEGYKITYCEGFDMFPQTTHLETVVHLTIDSIHETTNT